MSDQNLEATLKGLGILKDFQSLVFWGILLDTSRFTAYGGYEFAPTDGNFYTVGEILGHTFEVIGISLGLSMNFEAVTARYVDVRLERKNEVLNAYHEALGKTEPLKAETKKARCMEKKKITTKSGNKKNANRVQKRRVYESYRRFSIPQPT